MIFPYDWLVMFFAGMTRSSDRHECQRENREYKSLNETDENFKTVKHERQREEEERHDEQNHFARKNVAKETESERKDFCNLADEFNQPDEHIEKTKGEISALGFTGEQPAKESADASKVEKLSKISQEPERLDSKELHQKHRDERDGKSRVDVGGGRTEERGENRR